MNDGPAEQGAVAALMARHGIRRMPADRFHYKHYRYSRLEDALAQARRDDKQA